MKLKFNKTEEWMIPEGNYSAKLLKAGSYYNRKGKDDKLRFVFDVDMDDERNIQYLAHKFYPNPATSSSQLQDDLAKWLGQEFVLNNVELELDDLIGQPADIRIAHIFNDSHEQPFVHIESIHPPGSLIFEPKRIIVPRSNIGFKSPGRLPAN